MSAIPVNAMSRNATDVSPIDVDWSEQPPAKPCTLVVQPSGPLNQGSSSSFQRALEEALEQVSETVIVDLLWADAADGYGIAALTAGIQRAAVLGKLLSFQSMSYCIWTALESELSRQRALSADAWSDVFEQELERFLDMPQR